MAVNANKEKNKSRIQTRPILSLLIGLTLFTVILLIALSEAGKSGKSGVKKNSKSPGNQESYENIEDNNINDKTQQQ